MCPESTPENGLANSGQGKLLFRSNMSADGAPRIKFARHVQSRFVTSIRLWPRKTNSRSSTAVCDPRRPCDFISPCSMGEVFWNNEEEWPAEGPVLYCTALMLERDIAVISFCNTPSNPYMLIPGSTGGQQSAYPFMFIGNQVDLHFQSLLPTEE